MSDNAHSQQSHIGRYLLIGGILFVLTALTVGADYLQVGVFLGLMIGLAIAVTKGGLVLAYFMHLVGEHKLIYWVLGLTMFFFLLLLFLPVMTDSSSFENLLKN